MFTPGKDYATDLRLQDRPHDRDIFAASGAALGAALRQVVADEMVARTDRESDASGSGFAFGSSGGSHDGSKGCDGGVLGVGEGLERAAKLAGAARATFCSPLDEAFAECTVELFP